MGRNFDRNDIFPLRCDKVLEPQFPIYRMPSSTQYLTKKMPQVGDLLDVNVWLALSDTDHAHHVPASRYWEADTAENVAFCRVTMLGLLRLVTNQRSMAGRPFTITRAWQLYKGFLAEPGVRLTGDPDGVEEQLEAISNGASFSNKHWTDCYLAAFALCAGMRIVTFDRDFERFPDLDLLLLKQE